MTRAALVAASLAAFAAACGGAPTPPETPPVTAAPVVRVENARISTLALRAEAWPATAGVDVANALVDADVADSVPLGNAHSDWVFALADGAADIGAIVLWAPGQHVTLQVYAHDTGAPPSAVSWSRWHRTARYQGEVTAELDDAPVAFVLPRTERARYVWVSFLDGDLSLAEVAVIDAAALEQARAHGLSTIELRLADSPTDP